MPKTATDRLLLRGLLVIALLFVAALGVRLLISPRAAPGVAALPRSGSGATQTPARLAATAASTAAVRALAPTSELATIHVIVSRHDTLDRIFRRLSLSLADLASLRSLPGIRAQLDRLRPGEALTLTAKSGTLVGL